MSDRIAKLRTDFDRELAEAVDEAGAGALKSRWIGQRKTGLLIAEMKSLVALAPEERKELGARLNELRTYVEAEIEKLFGEMAARQEAEKLNQERVDVSLPGRQLKAGRLHPITLLRHKIEDIFVSMG